MEVKDFILTIDDAISPKTCKKLIELFEKTNGKQRIENNGAPNFTQLNVSETLNHLVAPISNTIVNHLEYYESKFPEFSKYFPEEICLEEFRIKCYDSVLRDRFDLHVDVTDQESSVRLLAFLYYLNDDFTGGETIFPEHDLIISPKPGSLIIFPPTWQYPHKGSPVKTGKKYIMSTYLHYY
jgi:hypothetical protein